MLIVNRNTLLAVNFLNLIHYISLESILAENRQNIVGVHKAVDERFTRFNPVAVVNVDVTLNGDAVGFLNARLFVFDGELTETARGVLNAHYAVNLRDNRGIFRSSRFEEFRNPRKTHCNIFCFSGFSGYFRNYVAGLDHIALVHLKQCSDGEDVALDRFVVIAFNRHAGLFLASCVGYDNFLGKTGDRVDLLFQRLAFDYIAESNTAGVLREDYRNIGIPLGYQVALLNRVAVFNKQLGSVCYVIFFKDSFRFIKNLKRAVPVKNHREAFPVLNGFHFIKPDCTAELGVKA